MYIFTIHATKKSAKWLKKYNIDRQALGAALSLLVAEVYPTIKVQCRLLTIQLVPNSDESQYFFRTDKIYIGETVCEENSYEKQQHIIFDHFLHEFRHWMQSRIYKIGVRDIQYTGEDVENNTNAYYRSKLEIDARQFVRHYLKKFIKYYENFKKN